MWIEQAVTLRLNVDVHSYFEHFFPYTCTCKMKKKNACLDCTRMHVRASNFQNFPGGACPRTPLGTTV